MSSTVRVMFGGDVMLGRLVADAIREHGPDYPLGAVAPALSHADVAIINLECAITDAEEQWHGAPKAFYFGAPTEALQSLVHAGIDLAVLANNHVLDFDIKGLRDTLSCLDRAGIGHAGAGANIAAARTPAIVSAHEVRIGLAAYCDHQVDFSAGEDRPGIAYLDVDDQDRALRLISEDLAQLRAQNVDWPVLSLHWGPNMVDRPSPAFREFAHRAIDAGYRLLFGHSAHVFHGIEIYRGCPILYAAGDLVDDYYVDPVYRNDRQLLFELELGKDAVVAVRLRPVAIDDCRVTFASGEAFDYIRERAERLCAEFGTRIGANADGSLGVVI